MNGVMAQHPEYVAPVGAKSSFSVWFYKGAAPTALRAKIGGRHGAAAQRRRRGISVEPRTQKSKAPAGRHIQSIGTTYCQAIIYALTKRRSGLTRLPGLTLLLLGRNHGSSLAPILLFRGRRWNPALGD